MKIGIVYNTDFYVWRFRGSLIKTLLVRGHEVFVVCPDGDYISLIKTLGAKHISIYVDRKGTNPLRDMKYLWGLYRIFKRNKFDLIHTFTIKPNIYGAIAGKMAGIRFIISSVVGLGYIFSGGENNIRQKMLRWIASTLYSFAFRCSDKIIFQNNDDLELFVSKGVTDNTKAYLIKSSGVNLNEFSPYKVNVEKMDKLKELLGLNSKKIIVTLLSRLIWEKGVKEFVEAARIVKERHPESLFLIVGDIDRGSLSAVPEDYLRKPENEGIIKWLGQRHDVREVFALSDIVALPSSYREGIPRSLIEAMAMGKPIITTNSVGCRETVEDGKNGFLIPPKDPVSLAEAIMKLVKNASMRYEFGKYARMKVEREFDERGVIEQTIEIYGM